MKDAALRELASNRGCKLVKSRRRTPGAGDYGRFGLEDTKTGKKVFGFGDSGLTATPDEIEDYLRGRALGSWKGSVGKRKRAAPAKAAPKPLPAPKLVIREARPADIGAMATLIAALGYEATGADVRRRLAAVRKAGGQVLVADQSGVLGVLTTSMTIVLHRSHPVGRISMLVVDEKGRGKGIGAALVAEAERRLAAKGCGLIEVTSNRRRRGAHAFYERLGYERTSYRFARPLSRR